MSTGGFCSHLNAIQDINDIKIGHTGVCQQCVEEHTQWVHLRTCQECGITLCCDDSPQQHMSKHNAATGHPVIASAQPGERWLWCYPDKLFMEY